MEILIRPAAPKDAEAMNEIRRMSGVMENTLAMPSEPIKKSEDYIAKIDANTHEFVAVIKDGAEGEKVVGFAGLQVYSNPRLRHSGGIGIMVHKGYQGRGIGKKLMEALIDVADNWLMLVRIELTVYTDNEKAINLYKKMGFETEGVKRKGAIRNGRYADLYMMSRIRES